jgi:hypothetical protein
LKETLLEIKPLNRLKINAWPSRRLQANCCIRNKTRSEKIKKAILMWFLKVVLEIQFTQLQEKVDQNMEEPVLDLLLTIK